ncbi:GNAT family N-acetyltransferase [archaeon]|nr:GNAT family N-acetyltransferase [archaeon]
MTYVCFCQNDIAAYVTLTTDTIRLDFKEKDVLPGSKARLREFPAIKIARLAVKTDHQRRGIGTTLLKASLGKIVELSKSVGCRFATVDAFPDFERFYEKLGFVRNAHHLERGSNTISMRYDLLHYSALSNSGGPAEI